MGNPVVRFEVGGRERPKNAAFYEQIFERSTLETQFTHEVDTGSGEGINGAGLAARIAADGLAPYMSRAKK